MSRKISPELEHDLSKIGSRIRFLRESRKESQIDFSKKTGISKGNLSGMENHKNDPSYMALVRIIETYNISPTWLITGQGPMDADPKNNIQSTDPEFGKYSFDFLDETQEPENQNVIDISHADIITRFKQKELARDINHIMVELEKADPTELEELKTYLEFRLLKKTASKSNKSEPWDGTERRKTARKQR